MKFLFPRLDFWLPILSISWLCVSCLGPSGNLQRFDDAASNPAIKSTPSVLVVLQPLKHRVYSYPAGRYIAKLTDSQGVYYEAPEKIVQHSAIAGPAVVTGGFYFPFSRPLLIHSYVVLGAPYKVSGEVTDLSYRFER